MSIELLSSFGDDLMVANVARVSYGKKVDKFSDKDAKLIKYLVDHKHTSPFRHPQLQFRITCPIYVERQLFKHNVGISVNSISGRYVDFSDTYYRITRFRKQSINSKQGSSGDLDIDDNAEATDIQNDVIDFCKQAYDSMLLLGVSKEQARSILPLSLNTTFIWTGSLLAFIHLCNLRLKPDAQLETRNIVYDMLELVKKLENNPFKESLQAYGYTSE